MRAILIPMLLLSSLAFGQEKGTWTISQAAPIPHSFQNQNAIAYSGDFDSSIHEYSFDIGILEIHAPRENEDRWHFKAAFRHLKLKESVIDKEAHVFIDDAYKRGRNRFAERGFVFSVGYDKLITKNKYNRLFFESSLLFDVLWNPRVEYFIEYEARNRPFYFVTELTNLQFQRKSPVRTAIRGAISLENRRDEQRIGQRFTAGFEQYLPYSYSYNRIEKGIEDKNNHNYYRVRSETYLHAGISIFYLINWDSYLGRSK